MNRKKLAEGLRDHPIAILISLLAAIVTILSFSTPTEFQNAIKGFVSKCFHPKTFFAKSDAVQKSEGDSSLSKPVRIPQVELLNSNEAKGPIELTNTVNGSALEPPKPSEHVDIETNYLCVIRNATDFTLSFHLNTFGKWGAAHVLGAHRDYYLNAWDSAVEIRFNPSLSFRSDEQDNTIDTLQTTGAVADGDWTNAPIYYFQINNRGQIDIFTCDCN